eukprot:scaffold14655_cov31-Tisochrysis_lutea.AAC.1
MCHALGGTRSAPNTTARPPPAPQTAQVKGGGAKGGAQRPLAASSRQREAPLPFIISGWVPLSLPLWRRGVCTGPISYGGGLGGARRGKRARGARHVLHVEPTHMYKPNTTKATTSYNYTQPVQVGQLNPALSAEERGGQGGPPPPLEQRLVHRLRFSYVDE